MSRAIYIASKTVHAPRWRALRGQGLRIVSSWIDAPPVVPDEKMPALWTRCVREASTADVTLVYREHHREVLKGALVEMGAALGAGKPVLWVGPIGGFTGAESDYTVAHHPGVVRFEQDELDYALRWIEQLGERN